MSRFLALVKKETLHILRDRRTTLIVLIVPVVLTVLYGFAISIEINRINFAVVAPRPGEAIRQMMEKIASNPYFDYKGTLANPDEIDRLMKRSEIDVALVFHKDVEKSLIGSGNAPLLEIVTDASNPNMAATATGYLLAVIGEGDVSATSAQTPQSGVRMLYNPQMLSAYNFVPGIMGLIFILICAMMTSVSIVREKETGTIEVLLVSPVRPINIIMAKMIPYFIISCINMTIILLLAFFLLKIPMEGSLIGLCVLSFIYIVLALAFGLLISTMADNQVTAILFSVVILLIPVIMLSGMLFPIENMPIVLQKISCIIPARWYISATRKLMIEGLPMHFVIKEVAVLILMAFVLIGIALKKFKDKLE